MPPIINGPRLRKATPNNPTPKPNPLLMVNKAPHLPRPIKINATKEVIDISKLLESEEVKCMVLKIEVVPAVLQ
jgi:hypothetical protein